LPKLGRREAPFQVSCPILFLLRLLRGQFVSGFRLWHKGTGSGVIAQGTESIFFLVGFRQGELAANHQLIVEAG